MPPANATRQFDRYLRRRHLVSVCLILASAADAHAFLHCYRADGEPAEPQSVELADRFGPAAVEVTAPGHVCADDVAQAVIYPAEPVDIEPELALIDDATGRHLVQLTRRTGLALPARVEYQASGAEAGTDAGAGAFCYAVVAVEGFAPADLADANVRGGPWALRATAPDTVCYPERINGRGPTPTPQAPSLACYAATPTSAGPPAEAVEASDRLGSWPLVLGEADRVCVPARVMPFTEPAEGSAFAFVHGRSALEQALTLIWRHRIVELGDPAALAAAEALVAANVATAANHVSDALDAVDPDDPQLLQLRALLPLVLGDSGLLDQLHARLSAPSDPDEGHAISNRTRSRSMLMRALTDAAQRDAAARERVLGLVQSADPRIRDRAVRGVHASTPQRRAAQRAMRRLIAPTHEHLLYRH